MSKEKHEANTERMAIVKKTESKYSKAPLWSLHSQRLRIAILLAIALCIEGLMRSNMNMAMVCMVNQTHVAQMSGNNQTTTTTATSQSPDSINRTTRSVLLPESLLNGSKLRLTDEDEAMAKCTEEVIGGGKKSYNGKIIWSAQDQANIFAAFYLGGLAVIIPGGFLCDRFGAMKVILYGGLINVIGSIWTPWVAENLTVWALIGLRFVMGCGQGVLFPCMSVLISSWFPVSEKSTALAIATTGNQLSIILAMFTTAELCQIPFLDGWPFAFYLYGVFGFVQCAIWMAMVKDIPNRSKKMSDHELLLITGTLDGRGEKRQPVAKIVPWSKVFTSAPIWSIAACSFSNFFVMVCVTTYLPLYYRTVLKLNLTSNLTSNGIMSSLPFIAQMFSKFLFARIADYLKENSTMSVSAITKAFNLLASIGTALAFVTLSFCDCTMRYTAITLVCLSMALICAFVPGYQTSVVSIAPAYTATIASFSRLWAQIGSALSPYLIGFVAKQGTMDEWRTIFITMSVVLVITGIWFQIYGSASEQSWAVIPPSNSSTIQFLPGSDSKSALAVERKNEISNDSGGDLSTSLMKTDEERQKEPSLRTTG